MVIDTPSPSLVESPGPATERNAWVAESLRLEHQLVRVSLEALKSTVWSKHRLTEKELATVLSSTSFSSAATTSSDGGSAVEHLTSLDSRLHGLKCKMDEGARVEEIQVQRCRTWLDRLAATSTGDGSNWDNMWLK